MMPPSYRLAKALYRRFFRFFPAARDKMSASSAEHGQGDYRDAEPAMMGSTTGASGAKGLLTCGRTMLRISSR